MSLIIKRILAGVLLASILALSACQSKIIEKRENTDNTDADAYDTATNETDVASESTAESEEPIPTVIPEYFNPLTGLGTTKELQAKRPVAVMINNIKAAMPQHGTSDADIIYECIVEGAQTRLMAVFQDYESIGTIGSVRSAREYYIDFAANHDAIFVHAGGSDEAYKQLKARKVNNLDGVNMYVPDMFYRDEQRLLTHALEHTLVTTGEKIKNGIAFKGYRDIIDGSYKGAFNFVGYSENFIPDGDDAAYVSFSYSPTHEPYYIYNEENSLYERYQFDEIQADENTGKALAFTNIIVLYLDTADTFDDYGHYAIDTTGVGKGLYISHGKVIEITWEKPDSDTPIKLYKDAATELLINRGKSIVQVCTTEMEATTVICSSFDE